MLISTGVSGGEKGALEGPSIMPGDKKHDLVADVLEEIPAKEKHQKMANHIVTPISPDGAGHYIENDWSPKLGIEYGGHTVIAA